MNKTNENEERRNVRAKNFICTSNLSWALVHNLSGPWACCYLLCYLLLPRGWLAAIFSSLNHEKLTRMVVTLWPIRYARRKAIHECSFQSPLSIHCFVNIFIAELEMIKIEQATPVRGTHAVPPWWINRPLDLVKINVDAATSKNLAAAIAWDTTSNFLGPSALVIRGLSYAEIVEAIACMEGLVLASDLMVQHFRLASDNVNVIRAIREDGMAADGHIIRETQAQRILEQLILFMKTGDPTWMLALLQGAQFILSLVDKFGC